MWMEEGGFAGGESRRWSRHDRASELLGEWDCLDELVDEEAWSQELVV